VALQLTHSIISGEGVSLEPLSPAHTRGLYTIGQEANDWKYLPRPCFNSIKDTAHWIDEACELCDRKQHYPYAIVETVSGEVMGSTRYLNIVPEDYGLEIGYTFLGKAYQRTRVNTIVKYVMLEHVFENLSAKRIELRTDQRNTRSQQAIERIGAVKEGVLRKHRIVQNGYVRDTVVYSILADEWGAIKPHLAEKLT